MHGQVAGDAVEVPQQVTEYDQAEICSTLSKPDTDLVVVIQGPVTSLATGSLWRLATATLCWWTGAGQSWEPACQARSAGSWGLLLLAVGEGQADRPLPCLSSSCLPWGRLTFVYIVDLRCLF